MPDGHPPAAAAVPAPARRTTLERLASAAPWALALAFAVSAGLRLLTLGIGGPQVMVDDFSLFEGGFLVWLGHAPPQHCYLESWLCGVTSLATYLVRGFLAHGVHGLVGLDVVPQAYRDFFLHPDPYYVAYRSVLSVLDLCTAWLVFRLARRVLGNLWNGWAAVLPAILYLASFNAYWAPLVGRPDTPVAFFAVLGALLYVRADYDATRPAFWWSAISLGIAAGLKLHGAFFAIFFTLDLFRVLGLRRGLRLALRFAPLAFFFFLVADGSLLFDPLKYVKARYLTYTDDFSSYLKFGQQFAVILRNTGWVLVVFLLADAWRFIPRARRERADAAPDRYAITFVALCWVLLFCLIRQLRGYWMLPMLPLVYVAAMRGIDRLVPRHAWRVAVAGVIVAVMTVQSVAQVRALHDAPLGDLRRWVVANIKPDEPFYVLGFSVLQLPKNTQCLVTTTALLEARLASDRAGGVPFTRRHLQDWEEQTQLRLIDYLGTKSDTGFEYYTYFSHPFEELVRVRAPEAFRYVIVQRGFLGSVDPATRQWLDRDFAAVTTRTGEGGDGSGIPYEIYRRRDALAR